MGVKSSHLFLLQDEDYRKRTLSWQNVVMVWYYVAKAIYVGMTVTDYNYIQEEIKNTLYLGNACYHSVQNLSVFHSPI